MSAETFRQYVLILAGIFVVGALVIGYLISENGRYSQYDQQKDTMVTTGSSSRGPAKLLDTRSGIVIPVDRKN